MENTNNINSRILKISTAIFGWVAVILQFYLIILNRTTYISETIIRYFSFFTIESNLLVALCFSILVLKPKSKMGLFFEKTPNITAVTLYILIVGITYNLILRFLWQPSGFQKIADELLHSVIPTLVLLHWLFFTQKQNLKYKHISSWLIFPSLFLIYTLIRGHFVLNYPYPFLDVTVLGYPTVLLNSLYMVMMFLFVGCLLIFVGRKMQHSKNNTSF